MPETATVAPTTPEIKPPSQTETLALGGEYRRKLRGGELAKGQKKGKELREFREQGDSARQAYERLKNSGGQKDFSHQQADSLTETFGAGKAKREENGDLTPPQDDREAQLIHEAAKRQITQVDNYLTYSQIAIESQATGKSIQDILTERQRQNLPGPKTEAEFQTYRDQSLDFILSVDPTGEVYGDLTKLSPAEKRDYIEDTLARDPELRSAMAKRMNDILESVKALEERPVDTELETANKDKTEATEQKDSHIDKAIEMLTDHNITVSDELREQLNKIINEGRPPETILAHLRSSIITIDKIPNANAFAQYLQDTQDIQSLETQIENFNIRNTDQSVVEKAKARQKAIEQRRDQQDLKFSEDINLKNEFETYKTLLRLTSVQKDADTGIYISPLAERLNDSVKAQKQINEADKTIKQKEAEATKKEDRWRKDRLITESQLLNQLESVMSASVGEVMLDRVNEYQRLSEEKQEFDAQEADKTLGEETGQAIRDVGKRWNKNWGRNDETLRKRVDNRPNIGRDIKYLAYHGEDGVRRLILRDLGFETTEVDPATGLQVKIPLDWKNVDIDSLPEQDKALFNAVYESQGLALKQRLFSDYYIANSYGGLTGGIENARYLKLKDFEYSMLQQHFGETFEGQISSGEDAKRAIQDLKEKGARKGGGLIGLLFGALIGTGVVASTLVKNN